MVRAAAVSALAQFGAACPDLLPNILVLLARCQMDFDDEVRDRATYYFNILSLNDKHLNLHYILEPPQVSELIVLKKLEFLGGIYVILFSCVGFYSELRKRTFKLHPRAICGTV